MTPRVTLRYCPGQGYASGTSVQGKVMFRAIAVLEAEIIKKCRKEKRKELHKKWLLNFIYNPMRKKSTPARSTSPDDSRRSQQIFPFLFKFHQSTKSQPLLDDDSGESNLFCPFFLNFHTMPKKPTSADPTKEIPPSSQFPSLFLVPERRRTTPLI